MARDRREERRDGGRRGRDDTRHTNESPADVEVETAGDALRSIHATQTARAPVAGGIGAETAPVLLKFLGSACMHQLPKCRERGRMPA